VQDCQNKGESRVLAHRFTLRLVGGVSPVCNVVRLPSDSRQPHEPDPHKQARRALRLLHLRGPATEQPQAPGSRPTFSWCRAEFRLLQQAYQLRDSSL
jgi:hypothetical protein